MSNCHHIINSAKTEQEAQGACITHLILNTCMNNYDVKNVSPNQLQWPGHLHI